MSNAVLNAVWPLRMPASSKAVLVALADRCDRHGRCWPAVADLVQRTCLSERSVQYALRWLEKAGALTVERGRHKANTYQVTPKSYQVVGVQPLHPARRAPRGVQHVHPTPATVAPEPSLNPHIEPSLPADAGLGAMVFMLGKQLLTTNGISMKSAGSLLGKLRKQHGDDIVLAAIKAAQREHVSDPAAFLVKTCGAATPRGRKSLAIGDQDYAAGWDGEKAAA